MTSAADRPSTPQVPEEALHPVDVDGVGAITWGTVAWAVLLVGCLLARDRLTADGNAWWIQVALTGALLGLPGIWYVRRRAAAYAAAPGTDATGGAAPD